MISFAICSPFPLQRCYLSRCLVLYSEQRHIPHCQKITESMEQSFYYGVLPVVFNVSNIQFVSFRLVKCICFVIPLRFPYHDPSARAFILLLSYTVCMSWVAGQNVSTFPVPVGCCLVFIPVLLIHCQIGQWSIH